MDSGKVVKPINIDLGLICGVKDVVEMIVTADERQQAEMIGKLAKIYYNHSSDFSMQLQYVSDYIKDNFNHDTQNVIKQMVAKLNEYLGEDK